MKVICKFHYFFPVFFLDWFNKKLLMNIAAKNTKLIFYNKSYWKQIFYKVIAIVNYPFGSLTDQKLMAIADLLVFS